MEDYGANTLVESVTILIQFINDNDPTLFLDGRNGATDYLVDFYEGGAVPVSLSLNLLIVDEDVGPQTFSSANITILDSECSIQQC